MVCERVSLRIRNFETGSITTPEKRDWQTGKFQAKTRTTGRPSKVNDRDGNPIDVICANLREDIQERLGTAGVDVVEARISHLAYAAEIAAAMLRRQQAQAVVAARAKIVEGAVGMVESALERITQEGIIELDDERRAAMVSNLLVVLCSDRDPQPVVNTGTLYQ
jgi:regulator of protease activity HflC (stomatin/prohibitin superfamily)